MSTIDATIEDALQMVINRRIQRLEEVLDEYEEEPIFEHLRERSSGIVVGTGSVMARVMFVGFSPGADEDEAGLPFVGKAGNVLDELLASIDANRETVYLTNVLKYRSHGGVDSGRMARIISTSMRYLRREIAVVKPHVLVLLGQETLAQFEPKLRLSSVHGKIINKKDRSIVPMHHPSAVVQDPNKRPVLMEDMESIQQAILGYQF